MVAVGLGAIVLVDIRQQVVDEVVAEDVTAKAHLTGNLVAALLGGSTRHRRRGILRLQLHGIAVGQHDNHLLGLVGSQQVVEDVVDAPHLVVDLLRVSSAADEVEYGVFLFAVHHVAGWQVDDGMVGGSQTLGVVADIFDAAVGHVEDVMRQCAVLRGNLQQAVLEALVREVLRVLRIHHAHAVNDVAVGIHVRGGRPEGHRPCAVGTTGHLLAASKLHVHQHSLGSVVLVTERHGPVIVRLWLRRGSERTGQQRKTEDFFHSLFIFCIGLYGLSRTCLSAAFNYLITTFLPLTI